MTSNKPYLIRALYEWICDNELTSHIVVAADFPDTQVPLQYVQDGRIVLNISPQAVSNFLVDNNAIQFDARFSGQPFALYIPIEAVMAIYAKENGEGMFFEVELPVDTPPDDSGSDDSNHELGSVEKAKPSHLKVVK